MKKIRIYLASTTGEMEELRKELGDYIRSLNDRYVGRDIYFKLVLCDKPDLEESAQEKEIRDSELFYIILGREADEPAIRDFELANKQFQNSGNPALYTYFRVLLEGEEADSSITEFKERLRDVLGHYNSYYTHSDTIKLNILLELTRAPQLLSNVEFKDGQAVLDGQAILELGNIPVYSKNEAVKRLKEELEELNQSYAQAAAEFGADNQNMEAYKHVCFIGEKRTHVMDELHQLEKEILGLCSDILELGRKKRKLSWREQEAIRLLEEGNADGALYILRDKQRKLELAQAEEIMDIKLETVVSHISENKLRIKTLKTKGLNGGHIQEITDCYEESVKLAEKYHTELDILYDYACFAESQSRYLEGIKIAERLQKWYELDGVSDEEMACLQNLLAMLLHDTGRYKESEGYYEEALGIYRRLAEGSPREYEAYVAMTCNNLANLLRATGRYKESEKYYGEALGIYRRLAKGNPEAYEADVAMTCNNLANLLSATGRHKESERYYGEALGIRRRLAEGNPEAYEAYVAATCNNLAVLLSATGRHKESEEYYREALGICRRLAEGSPGAYEAYVAATCNNLAALLSGTGRYKESEKYFEEALGIYRKLAETNPEVYESDVNKVCKNLNQLINSKNLSKEPSKLRNILKRIVGK